MHQTVLEVKLGFDHKQVVNLPGEKVRVLAVGARNKCISMWIEAVGFIDTAQTTPVTVFVAMNGETYDDMKNSQYVGTVQMDEKDLHIYVSGVPLSR